MAIKSVVYTLTTEDYELAKKVKEVLDGGGKSWKLITEFRYDGESKKPVRTTSEESR
jgi:hypothetical protein